MPIRCCAWQALDKQLPKLEEGSSAAAFSMENVLAEVEDLLSYCNDILCTGSRRHSRIYPGYIYSA